MRLAFALGSLLAISFCSAGYPPTSASDAPGLSPDSPDCSFAYASQFPLIDVVQKAKPNVKGKPLPPKPDALPTYELVAAVHVMTGALQIDLVR